MTARKMSLNFYNASCRIIHGDETTFRIVNILARKINIFEEKYLNFEETYYPSLQKNKYIINI